MHLYTINAKFHPSVAIAKSKASILRATHLFQRDSSPKMSAETLQQKLDAALPAERPWTIADVDPRSETPALDRNQIDPKDGVWVCCCCKHENRLTHFQGAFPFKYLACDKCDKVLCRHCCTTEILTPISNHVVRCLDQDDCEPRFCQVCPECGLSRRAVLADDRLNPSKDACPCGCDFSDMWLWYRIGSVDSYRANPVRITIEILNKISSDAMWRRLGGEPPTQLEVELLK